MLVLIHFFSYWHWLKIEKENSKFHNFAFIFQKKWVSIILSTDLLASKTMIISRISRIVVWKYSGLILTLMHKWPNFNSAILKIYHFSCQSCTEHSIINKTQTPSCQGWNNVSKSDFSWWYFVLESLISKHKTALESCLEQF